MSLQPCLAFEIPDETRRVARAAFPHGTFCLAVADALGPLYADEQFADLFPRRGQPAESPGRLAWATVLQFVENLSDRAAADAVRGRLDWKYLLGLELTDPGFDHTVLSEFRTRLTTGEAEQRLLDMLLTQLQKQGLLKARGRQRTDSTHVLAAVRNLNRLERVGETLRAALNGVATVAPDWLRVLAPPTWHERYDRRVEGYRLPKTESARQSLAADIGADGQTLLDAIDVASAYSWLANLPAVQTLRQVWEQQYRKVENVLVWRAVADMPAPADLIDSPYDPEARYSVKRDTTWVGYKLHQTETCDAAAPRLIVNVETTVATVPDDHMLATVHASLARRHLLPAEHLVDKGYTSAQVLLDSARNDGVRIIGPVADDPSWQAQAGAGFDKAHFHIDWDAHVVTCPTGRHSHAWLPKTTTPGIVAQAHFSTADCTPCPQRAHCTKSKKQARVIGIQPRDQYEVLQTARQVQTTEAFRTQYAARAGVESAHAQAVRRCGLRVCRYIGLAKTRLQHVVTAVAINLIRVWEWLAGTLIAPTRCSRFAALQGAT
jgi:transposase